MYIDIHLISSNLILILYVNTHTLNVNQTELRTYSSREKGDRQYREAVVAS